MTRPRSERTVSRWGMLQIDANPRSASRKLERKTAARAQRAVGHVYAEQLRYSERTRSSVSMVVSRTSSAVAKSACEVTPRCCAT